MGDTVAAEPVDIDPAAKQEELATPTGLSSNHPDYTVQPWPPTAAEEPVPAEAQAEGQEEQQSTTQDAAEPEQKVQAAEEAASPAPAAAEPSSEEALPAQDVEPAPAAENPAPSELQEVPTEQTADMSPEITAADAEVGAEEVPIELLSPAAEGSVKPVPLSSQSEASIREYLDSTVVPVLRDGLRMLVKERPEDPCNYLVDYIKANHP